MVQRPNRGFFGGIVVFPGGKVDEIDRSDLARDVVTGDSEDHEFRTAALRELAEETGLAATSDGLVEAPDARDATLLEDIREAGQELAGDALVLVSRWVTPEMASRRFDTWFYLLAADSIPAVRLDPDELVDHDWVTPSDALRRSEDGEWQMILPTLAHLRWLARRGTIDEAIDSARGDGGRTLIEPKRLDDGSILLIHLPGDQR